MIESIVSLAKEAGPSVAAVVVVLLVLVFGTKYLGVGFTVGSKTKLIDDDKLTDVVDGVTRIDNKIDAIERRVAFVEHDVDRRATRDEVHQLELAFTRMEARFEAIDARTSATAHGVSRIESFMYEAAVGSRRDRRET